MYVAQVFLEFDVSINPTYESDIAAASGRKIRYTDVKLNLFNKFRDYAKSVFTSEPFHFIKSNESSNDNNSFYVVSYTVTDVEDKKIKWIVKLRVSDHNIKKTTLTEENLSYVRKNHSDSDFSEDSIYYKDCEIVLRIRGRVKSVHNKNISFLLNFDGNKSDEIPCSTIEEVFKQIDSYAVKAYNECNQELMSNQDNLFGSSKIQYYGAIIDLDDIDLDDLVDRYLIELHNTDITVDFIPATNWYCTAVHFEDDYQTIVLDVQDNLDNEFYLETEIDLELYINDKEYQNLLIEDLVNITFEYYEQGGLIYV